MNMKLEKILECFKETCHDEMTGFNGTEEPCNKDCKNCDAMLDTMADIRERAAKVLAEAAWDDIVEEI